MVKAKSAGNISDSSTAPGKSVSRNLGWAMPFGYLIFNIHNYGLLTK